MITTSIVSTGHTGPGIVPRIDPPPSPGAPRATTSQFAPLFRRPQTGRQRSSISDSYRLGRVLLGVMVLVAIDTKDFFDKGGKARYVLPVIPIIAAGMMLSKRHGDSIRRPRRPDLILLALMSLGLVGSLYGTFFRGTQSTALPVFLPMLVGFTYLVAVDRPSDDEVRKLIRGIAMVGLLYTFMNALANTGALSSVFAEKVYRNSKVFFILIGISAAILTRRRVVLSAMIVLGMFVFVTYPSATDVIVVLVTIMTFWMTRPSSSRMRPYAILGFGLVILILALVNLGSTTTLTEKYFSSVGKQSDTTTRLALWEGGIQLFKESPLYGSAFSGEITILVYRQLSYRAPFKAPFHDDYVMLLATGGLLGIGLVLWWIAATERDLLRRYRAFLAAGQPNQANLLRVVLVAINVVFTAALFNPELSGAARGTVIFGLYALAMLPGSPAQAPPARSSRVSQDVRTGAVAPT